MPTEGRGRHSQWPQMSSCPVGGSGDPSYSSRASRWVFGGFPPALPFLSVPFRELGSGVRPGRAAGRARKQTSACGTQHLSAKFCPGTALGRGQTPSIRGERGSHLARERPALPRPAAAFSQPVPRPGWAGSRRVGC